MTGDRWLLILFIISNYFSRKERKEAQSSQNTLCVSLRKSFAIFA
jgi:hypothetical protein